MRGRSYSRSPSPPRRYERRGRSPSPRCSHRGRGRDLPSSILIRNLHRDCRHDDLRGPFGQFGPIKDIYLPLDYHTREPRGFGFIQFVDPDDAVEAKHHMDGQKLNGRKLTVVFAEENRKKPYEMRARTGREDSHDHRRSPRYTWSRSRSPRHSRSPWNGRSRTRSHSASPRRKPRSVSPKDRTYRKKPYFRSPVGSRSRSRSPADYPCKTGHRERSVC